MKYKTSNKVFNLTYLGGATLAKARLAPPKTQVKCALGPCLRQALEKGGWGHFGAARKSAPGWFYGEFPSVGTEFAGGSWVGSGPCRPR